jgi:thiol-disulfide isomerase/thioredoxin
MKKYLAPALLIFLGMAPALGEVPAPVPSIDNLAQLPVVVAQPYDEKADADAAVTAAFEKAKRSQKLVLLDLGGNWCPDCIVLANFLQLPEIKQFTEKHYEIVAVDVGRFNRNLQVPARFGFTERLKGVPTVLVATPDGKLVNQGNVFAFTDARHMTPKALADYIAKWPQGSSTRP